MPAWKDIVIVPYQEHRFYPEVGCVAADPIPEGEQGTSLTIAGGVLSVDAAEKRRRRHPAGRFYLQLRRLILTEMELEFGRKPACPPGQSGVCSLVTDIPTSL